MENCSLCRANHGRQGPTGPCPLPSLPVVCSKDQFSQKDALTSGPRLSGLGTHKAFTTTSFKPFMTRSKSLLKLCIGQLFSFRWLHCGSKLQNNRNQRCIFITFVFWHNYHHQFRRGTCCGSCLLPGSHFPFVHSHRAGTTLQLWAPGAAGERHAADTPHAPSQSLWRHFWPFQPCLVSVSPVKPRAALC